jgi:hypothetical protein
VVDGFMAAFSVTVIVEKNKYTMARQVKSTLHMK